MVSLPIECPWFNLTLRTSTSVWTLSSTAESLHTHEREKAILETLPDHWLNDVVHRAVCVQFSSTSAGHLVRTCRRETSWSPYPDDNRRGSTCNGSQSCSFRDRWHRTPTSSLNIAKTNVDHHEPSKGQIHIHRRKMYEQETVIQLQLSEALTSSSSSSTSTLSSSSSFLSFFLFVIH